MSEHLERAHTLLDSVTSNEHHRVPTRVSHVLLESLAAIRLALGQERPKGWAPGKFNIMLAHTLSLKEVDGIKHQECLLGIHVSDAARSDVTHIPSGKRLATFATLGAAMRFVESIKDVYSWRDPELDIPEETRRLIMACQQVCIETTIPRTM